MKTFTVHVYRQDSYPTYIAKGTDKCVRLGDNRFLFKTIRDGITYLTTVKRKLAVKDGRATTVYKAVRCVEIV